MIKDSCTFLWYGHVNPFIIKQDWPEPVRTENPSRRHHFALLTPPPLQGLDPGSYQGKTCLSHQSTGALASCT